MKTNTLLLIFVISIVLLILIGSTFATPIKSFFSPIIEVLTAGGQAEPQEECQEQCDEEFIEPIKLPFGESSKPKLNVTLDLPITENISEVSGTPYNYTELRLITNISLSHLNISDEDMDKIFMWLAQKTKTFTGEKYIEFKPSLIQSYTVLYFYGQGYVDSVNIGNDFKADGYFIPFNVQDGKIVCNECNIARRGVTEEIKEIAENIVVEREPDIPERLPLYSIEWFPDKPEELNLEYITMIPEAPCAWVTIDLDNNEIIKVLRGCMGW